MIDPSQCPLCGQPNDCQRCTALCYKGPCWCFGLEIPANLLGRVPEEFKNQACICQKCIELALREEHRAKPLPAKGGEFYFEAGLIVFTAAYHLRRGYCCGSGCRHCPYPARAS